MGRKSDSNRPRIVVLYCAHCVPEDVKIPGTGKTDSSFRTRFEMMPCSGKVDEAQVLKILAAGAEALQLVACPPGDCSFLTGNLRAAKRMERARKLLEEIGENPDRLGIEYGSGLSGSGLEQVAEKRMEALLQPA